MEATQVLRDYLDTLTAARERVEELEKDAGKVIDQQAAYEAVQSAREARENDIRAFEEEHANLRGAWLEASWNEDAQAQRDIRNRRKQLDQQIAELEADDGDPDGPNPRELAELAVARNSLLNLPSADEVLEAIAAELEAKRGDLIARANAATIPAGMDPQHYHDQRMKLDPQYAAEQRRKAELDRAAADLKAKRDARAAKYGSGSSTDAIHAAMLTPRTLTDAGNLTVIESGRELPYGDLDD